jgi:hypothetical protein
VRTQLTVPIDTQWHHDHGRGSRRDKATNQQLPTLREEQIVVSL